MPSANKRTKKSGGNAAGQGSGSGSGKGSGKGREAVHPQQSFRCPICLLPFVVPATTQCGHTFCCACLYQVACFFPRCPICAKPLYLQN